MACRRWLLAVAVNMGGIRFGEITHIVFDVIEEVAVDEGTRNSAVVDYAERNWSGGLDVGVVGSQEEVVNAARWS